MTPRTLHKIRLMRMGSTNKDIELFDAISGGQWPNGVIPFMYQSSYIKRNLQNAVNAAVREYNAKTCIRWKEISRAQASQYRNYVIFMKGGGCYSMIGRQRSRQQISLGRGCESKGIAIHEMMHALGFFHEQSRRDRDSYITINWYNIPSRVRYNFEKYRSGQASTLGEPYDKQSIMHYGNYAFSNNRQMTIVSRSNSRETLGQRNGLSRIDVNQLRKYYKCDKTKATSKPVTKKPQPPLPPTGCKNNYPFCEVLGPWCKTITWVKSNCKKKCGLCPKPKPCLDKGKYCKDWSKSGYCKHTYAGYMNENCKKSCNKC